jgi:hypothetical protein
MMPAGHPLRYAGHSVREREGVLRDQLAQT